MAEMCKKLAGPGQRKKAAALTPRLQSYANQSLIELTERLVKCSKEEKGQNLTSRTRDIVYVLKVHKLRHSFNAHAFYARRGVEALLALLSLCVGQEGRDRGLLVATLGNLCALHGDCRAKVMSHGLPEVVSVLAQTSSPATLCTVARLLANLALDTHSLPRLLEMGVVRELSHALFFQTASDSACKLSVLRAVRLLSASVRCRDELKASEGLAGVVDCLKSAEEEVAVSALHTVVSLLVDRDPDVIQALAASAGLPHVVRLCSHSDSAVAGRAVEILVCCARASEGRVGFSSAGGVECLLQKLETQEHSSPPFPAIVTALCASCRDVLGRQHMRDSGGLERLIQMLSSSELAALHGEILSALVCYYFDEMSLKLMVKKLGLLRALTWHLQQMTASLALTREAGEGTEDSMSNEEDGEVGSMEEMDKKDLEGSVEGGQEMVEEMVLVTEKEGSPNPVTELSDDVEGTEYSSPSPLPSISAASVSSMPSGLSLGTSLDRTSPLSWPLSSGSKEDTSSSNQGSYDSPLCTLRLHTPSPLSCSSPSCPTSPSPSPPEEAQPPAKRQRLSSDIEFARPMPANFLDSLLSSPSPYQTPSRQPEPPLVPDLSPSLEGHVVQLLSRVSHLRDCLSHLASRDLLLALLACFLSSPASPNTHIFKTLSRVFASPHCFQEAVSCLMPSKLYQQLYLTPACPPLSLEASPLLCDDLDISSPAHTMPSPPHFSLHSLSRRLSSPSTPTHSTPAPRTPAPPAHSTPAPRTPAPPAHSTPAPRTPAPRTPAPSTPAPSTPAPRSSSTGLGHMCQELLCRLSRVGESPYGQGVLAHLLLAGEERDKEASALAAPLLCRAPRVCQRLMLDYQGQAVLVQLMASSALGDLAADSLLALASTAGQLAHRKGRGLTLNSAGYAPDTSAAAGETGTRRDPSPPRHLPAALTGVEPGQTVCRYQDSDHCPFDFVVVLSQPGAGVGQTSGSVVRLPVHRNVLMEASEVLRAMLGGHYLESGSSEVFLRDVHPQAFRSIVHHMYGCGWLCGKATSDLVTHSAKSHDQSGDQQDCCDVTDSTIAAVSLNFDLPSEQAVVSHTLRCLATASRFLLSSLCGESERQAAGLLSRATAVPLFLFSQLHQSCWLAEQSVRCVVGLPPSLPRRACLLQLAASAEGDTAMDMLQRLVSTQLLHHTP